MAETKRTLEITAQLRDQFSRQFRRMGQAFGSVIRFSFLAPLRALRLSLRAMRSFLVAFGTASVAAFAVLRSGQSIGNILDTADALSKLGRQVGTSTEDISQLQKAFEFAGIESERFRAIVTGLGRGISTALTTGAGPQFEAFGALGITLEQLRSESYEQIFERIALGLQGFNTQAERAAILQRIFPDNFLVLTELLGNGADGFRDLTEEAGRFGAALDGRLGVAAEAVNDDLLRLRIVLEDIARVAVISGLDELRPFFRDLIEAFASNREAIISGLKAAVQLFVELAAAIGQALASLVLFLNDGVEPLAKLLSGLNFGSGLGFDLNFGDQLAEGLGIVPLGPAEFVDEVTGQVVVEDTRKLLQRLEELTDQFRKRQRVVIAEGIEGEADRSLQLIRAELEQVADTFAKARQGQFDEAGQPGLGPDTSQVLDRIDRGGSLALLVDQIAQARASLGTGLEDVVEPFERVNGAADELNRELAETKREGPSVFGSIVSGVEAGIAALGTFQQALQGAGRILFDNVVSGFSSAFADVITGAKSASEAFKDLGRSILRTIAELIPRLLLIRLLSGPLGGLGVPALAQGGVTKGVVGTLPVKAYAQGGVADSPQIAIFGEAGEEAFVPLQSGRIPVRIDNPAPSQFVFAPQVNAVESRSGVEFLIKNRQTLRTLYENDLASRSSTREAQRAAR